LFFFSFYHCILIVHNKSFIVTFTHIHTMYFGHIHLCITPSYPFPVYLPFLLPTSLPCVFKMMFPELSNTSVMLTILADCAGVGLLESWKNACGAGCNCMYR
jgi:hypothetical protein